MSERVVPDWARAIGEGMIVALVAIACSLVLGFVFPVLRQPVTISLIALAAGLGWTFRPEQRQGRYVVFVVLAVLALSIPFAIWPTYLRAAASVGGLMRTAVWTSTIAAMVIVLGSGAAIVLAGVPDNRVAAMRDTLMEPAVPMGALVVMPDGRGLEEGEVTAFYPQASEGGILQVLLGQVLVRRYVGRSSDFPSSLLMQADARPDLAPQDAAPGDLDGVAYYVPLLGYALWFGPIGLLVCFVVVLIAMIVLYVTHERGRRVVVAPTGDTRVLGTR